MTASSLTSICRAASTASHHHADRRHGELAHLGTGLVGVVVVAMATGTLAWASGLAPIRRIPGADHGEAAVTISPSASQPGVPIYPGGSGAVTFAITNHMGVAVRVSAISLPSATTYAAAFRDPADTTPATGCTTHNSGVTWRGATGAAGTPHRLAAPLTVGAGGTRLVTITDAAAMRPDSPPACQGAFFSMPSLTGITAAPATGTIGTTPVVDSWN
jgi:hypothetical protein